MKYSTGSLTLNGIDHCTPLVWNAFSTRGMNTDVSKPLSSRQAPIGTTDPVSAICWITYSGNITMCGRLSWLLWMYLSIVCL